MKAVDTNVLARFVLGDDPTQSPIAAELLQSPCFVSDTVLLETAWLLSSRYGLDRAIVAATLRDLLNLASLSVSSVEHIEWAINGFASGADFADLLHIATSRHADSFVSFEKHLPRRAGPDAPIPIETLA